MRTMQAILASLLIVSVATGAAAQVKPAAEPIIGHIPAGTMGYIVINNADGALKKVEKFLGDIGMGAVLGGQETPGALLQMIQAGAKLGEGFNPNGGVAVLMLDPQQYGIDFVKMMKEETKPDPSQLPIVMAVAGSSVKEVFGLYDVTTAGKYAKVAFPGAQMVAAPCGGYVLLSPMAKALDAVLAARKKAPAELSKDEAALMKRSDLCVYMNMKIVGPMYIKIMKVAQEKMAAQQAAGGMPATPFDMMGAGGMLEMFTKIYSDLFNQMNSLTMGVQMADTGVVIEQMVTFAPDSKYAKMLAAYGAGGKPPLGRLSNLPYVLAFGMTLKEGEGKAAFAKLSQDMMDAIFSIEQFAAISAETKAKIKKLNAEEIDQVTGMQMVAGGAPGGSGVFGLGMVIECKDSAKYKALMAEETKLGLEVVKELIKEQELQQLQVTYDKGVDTLGSISIDAITISHPKLAEMPEEERAMLTKVLGEDKIRVFVAAIDKTTVVSTIGGGKPFLADAIKRAKEGGSILAEPGTIKALKYMPRNCSGVGLLNAGNLFEVIRTGMQAYQPGGAIPFNIACKTPIAVGGGVTGSAGHAVVYVPNELIKEISGIVQMFMGGMGGGAPAPGPGRGADDF